MNNLPQYVFWLSILFFALGSTFLLIRNKKKAIPSIFALLLSEYIIVVYCSTVLFRAAKDLRKYDLTPFWSYDRPDLFVENIMNIVAFVPIGILLGCSFHNVTWWKTLLIGISISVSIEISQFYLMRGFSEIDDVMHNTFGCVIGYGFYSLIKIGYDRILKKRVAVL